VHYVTTPQPTKSHFDFGNAFELYLIDQVLNTNYFKDSVSVFPSTAFKAIVTEEKPDIKQPTATTRYKALESEFKASNAKKYIINDVGETESYEALVKMAQSCLSDPVVRAMLSGSDYQESFFWTDAETGVKLKTRPDLSKKKKRIIFDVKTCADASPQGFARQAANLDYPIQAVCQIEGAKQTGYFDDCDGYFWLAVEKTPPYNYAIYEFQKSDIEDSYSLFRHLLKKAAKALPILEAYLKDQTAFVPSYGDAADNPHRILALDVPLWYRYSF
jgi:hypothetical protein